MGSVLLLYVCVFRMELNDFVYYHNVLLSPVGS